MGLDVAGLAEDPRKGWIAPQRGEVGVGDDLVGVGEAEADGLFERVKGLARTAGAREGAGEIVAPGRVFRENFDGFGAYRQHRGVVLARDGPLEFGDELLVDGVEHGHREETVRRKLLNLGAEGEGEENAECTMQNAQCGMHNAK